MIERGKFFFSRLKDVKRDSHSYSSPPETTIHNDRPPLSTAAQIFAIDPRTEARRKVALMSPFMQEVIETEYAILQQAMHNVIVNNQALDGHPDIGPLSASRWDYLYDQTEETARDFLKLTENNIKKLSRAEKRLRNPSRLRKVLNRLGIR